jgi:uncharacterized protein (DUF58 family)
MNQPAGLQINVDAGNISGFYARFSFDLPHFWSSSAEGTPFYVEGNLHNEFEYPLRALRRGKYSIRKLHMRFLSPLSLFQIYKTIDINLEIPVYPDYRELKEYFLLSKNNRLFEMGIHKNRYKGQGTELESLREYTKDDDARYIDWKATARFNKPVTKVFQMESVNDVVFVLDCGRLMTSEEKNQSSIDLAIQSLLVLAHVAQTMGDRIRIIAFSDRIIGDFSPPKQGNAMKKILGFVTPLQPEFVESNYSLVFSHLHNRIRKRSLIILVSDLIDDINYPLFKKNLTQLSRKNAILFLLLRDRLLQEEADKKGESIGDIYNITAARSMFINRSKAIFKLRQSGIPVLDLLPEQVTAGLVDKYMEMKAKNKI